MQETEYMVRVSDEVVIQSSLYTSTESTEKSILCIITHPYSPWGGSMHNNVVIGVRNQLVKGNYPCITFNFRGVGKSTGTMGDGIDEQRDLIAICNFAKNTLHYSRIFIVGYSYGGLIALSTAENISDICGMSLISYPIGFVKHLSPLFTIQFPLLLVHGEFDDIIPLPRVKNIIPKFKISPKLVTVSTNHFYMGKERQVGVIVREFLEKLEIR